MYVIGSRVDYKRIKIISVYHDKHKLSIIAALFPFFPHHFSFATSAQLQLSNYIMKLNYIFFQIPIHVHIFSLENIVKSNFRKKNKLHNIGKNRQCTRIDLYANYTS